MQVAQGILYSGLTSGLAQNPAHVSKMM